MIFSGSFCVDPGSDTIKIYAHGADEIFTEKTCIAVNQSGEVYASGEEAYRMTGTTPKSIRIQTPVSEGKITDVYLFDRILEYAFSGKGHFLGIKPDLYFSVPADMTEIERRAYASVSKRGKLKNCSVSLVERAYADAVSFGLDISSSKGILIVNMGSSGSYASVVSGGRIILERAIPVGGFDINEYIISSIRKKNNLFIASRYAEELKIMLGGFDEIKAGGAQVTGMDTQAGLPRDGYITAQTIRTAIRERCDVLISHLEEFIHRIPPQVLEKVKVEGIHLAGGCSRIEGLSGYLARELNMPVVVSEHFERSTVVGMKILMENGVIRSLSRTPVIRRKA